jgi:predicted RNase H-like HicB family nuclease
MLTEYIKSALRKAKYEILEDNTFYAEIPGFKGLYANADTLEECRDELESTLEDWILFSISKNLLIPVIDGHDLKIKDPIDA